MPIFGERGSYKAYRRSKEKDLVLISVTRIMILSFLIILCAPYKKKERKRQGKKRTTLWFVYGPAMFMVDRLPDKTPGTIKT